MTVSYVLFIQIFPDKVREISLFRDETHTSQEKRGEGGSQKKNEQGAEQNAGGVDNPPERCEDFSGDKYKEHPKEDPREFRERDSTSSSEKPDKPASFNTFSPQTEPGMNAEGKIPESKDSLQPGDESQKGRTEDCSPDQDEPGVDENDFDRIRTVLEAAFGGQTFTAHGEKKLQEHIACGRVTRTWVDAFARAKSVFDQNREAWNKEKAFIPVQPRYLISDYDLTASGILAILEEQHQSLQRHLASFDEELCQRNYETYKKTLNVFDRELRAGGCLDPEYSKWVAEYPGRRNQVVDVLCDPYENSNSPFQGAVPPAWMRVHYAWFNRAYGWEIVRSTLLAKAQEEIRQNPRILKSASGELKDAAIKELFELDYPSELQRCEKAYDRIDSELARLEKWIGAVGDCKCAGESGDPVESSQDAASTAC